MKHIHVPTFIILGVSIFCASVASFDMANAIQLYWSGLFAILILTYDGKKLEGTIIGTEGEPWARKENVFDGNILTGFGANSPDGNWVGLKLDEPSKVSRIKYIGRNDGNGIEQGDEYELYYWNQAGYWKLLGETKAMDNVLYFSDVPSNGLYILKDITKGKEERIFTYENNRQIWW